MHVIKDPFALEAKTGSGYPGKLAAGFEGRSKRPMTSALGLTQFGINMTTLAPGAMSSLRHWHVKEDECVFIVSGELWLATNDGETKLTAGMAAGFPAGEADGHHLINRSAEAASYLEIGTRSSDEDVTYSDVDLKFIRANGHVQMTRKSGEPY